MEHSNVACNYDIKRGVIVTLNLYHKGKINAYQKMLFLRLLREKEIVRFKEVVNCNFPELAEDYEV